MCLSGQFCPGVVFETDRSPSFPRVQRGSETLQALEPIRIALFAQVFKMSEGSARGPVDATVDTFDVVLVGVEKSIDKGVRSRTDRAGAWTNRCP